VRDERRNTSTRPTAARNATPTTPRMIGSARLLDDAGAGAYGGAVKFGG
jgi:hypothetical protein